MTDIDNKDYKIIYNILKNGTLEDLEVEIKEKGDILYAEIIPTILSEFQLKNIDIKDEFLNKLLDYRFVSEIQDKKFNEDDNESRRKYTIELIEKLCNIWENEYDDPKISTLFIGKCVALNLRMLRVTNISKEKMDIIKKIEYILCHILKRFNLNEYDTMFIPRNSTNIVSFLKYLKNTITDATFFDEEIEMELTKVFYYFRNIDSIHCIEIYLNELCSIQFATKDKHVQQLIIKRFMQILGEYIKATNKTIKTSQQVNNIFICLFGKEGYKNITTLRNALSHNENMTSLNTEKINEMQKNFRLFNFILRMLMLSLSNQQLNNQEYDNQLKSLKNLIKSNEINKKESYKYIQMLKNQIHEYGKHLTRNVKEFEEINIAVNKVEEKIYFSHSINDINDPLEVQNNLLNNSTTNFTKIIPFIDKTDFKCICKIINYFILQCLKEQKSSHRDKAFNIIENFFRFNTFEEIKTEKRTGESGQLESYTLKEPIAIEMFCLEKFEKLKQEGKIHSGLEGLEKEFPTTNGIAMRNYLAHGDLLIDLTQISISKQLKHSYSKLHDLEILENNNLKIGYSCKTKFTNVIKQQETKAKLAVIQDKFFCASQQNKIRDIEEFIANGADVNARNYRGWTGLHFAVKGNSPDSFMYLLDQGLKPSYDIDQNSIFHLSAKYNSTTLLQHIQSNKSRRPFHISYNLSVCITNKNGYTPLHLAAIHGNHEIIKILLELVDTDMTDLVLLNIPSTQEEDTPLGLAIANKHINVVNELLAHKVDVNISNINGNTPLHIAAQVDALDIAKILIKEENINVIAKNEYGITPFQSAANHNSHQLLEFLLKQENTDILIKEVDNLKKTVLHIAAFQNNYELLQKFLTNSPVLLQNRDSDGWTTLHVASWRGNSNILNLLLENGAILCFTNNNQTELHLAAESGNDKCITNLLEYCVGTTGFEAKTTHEETKDIINTENYINARDISGATALHYAAAQGNYKTLNKLIEKDADIHIVTNNEETSLLFAAKSGNMQCLKILLKKSDEDKSKEFINLENKQGKTALHYAAEFGKDEALKVLLENGADIHRTTEQNETSLHFASRSENTNCVKILLDYCSADGVQEYIYLKDKEGKTALSYAMETGKIETFSKLLNPKENNTIKTSVYDNVHLKDKDGKTVLHYAAEAGKNNVLKQLLKNDGSNIYTLSNTNRSSLHFATISRNVETVKIILENCDREKLNQFINLKDIEGKTALHYTVQFENSEILKLLLDYDADTNLTTNEKETSLHLAVRTKNTNCVKHILDSCSRDKLQEFIKLKNLEGKTAVYCAAEAKNKEALIELFDRNADEGYKTSLLHAATVGDMQCVSFILHYYPKDKLENYINTKDSDGKTVLHYIVEAGGDAILKRLINLGTNIHHKTKENKTSLHFAVKSQNINCLLSLLNHCSANGIKEFVNSKDYENRTALHYAAEIGITEALKILLDHEGDMNVTTNQNKTILHLAVKSGNINCVKSVLNNYPIDKLQEYVHLKDSEGKTAMYFAAEARNGEILEELFIHSLNNSDEIETKLLNYEETKDRGKKEFDLILFQNLNIFSRNETNETSLHCAAMLGDVECIHFLLNHCPKDKFQKYINLKDSEERTALYCAVELENIEVFKELLNRGADEIFIGKDTILQIGVKSIQEKFVKFILNHYDNDKIVKCINSKDSKGKTTLHYAAKCGNIEILKNLIQHGGDVYSMTKNNKTMLHYAVKGRNINCVTFILDLIPKEKLKEFVNFKDNEEYPALYYALYGRFEIFKILYDLGGDIYSVDKYNNTILYYAVVSESLNDVTFILDLIPKEKVKDLINWKDSEERTTLHFAALYGLIEILKILHDMGGDIYSVDKYNQTVLHFAVKSKNLNCVKTIINFIPKEKLKEFINLKGFGEGTTLHEAAQAGQSEILKILHDMGGDIYSVEKENSTILHYALFSKNFNCVKFILDLIPKEKTKGFINLKDSKGRTVLHYAAFNGLIKILKMLHDLGGDIYSVDDDSLTILHFAVLSKNLNSVKLVLDFIPKEKLKEFINLEDYEKITALHYAAGIGKIEILKILYDLGGDIYKVNNNKSTILLPAVRSKNLNCVNFILDLIPKENLKDFINLEGYEEKTALHEAAENGQSEILKILHDLGGDMYSVDEDSRTALHFAVKSLNINCVKIILDLIPKEELKEYINLKEDEGRTALHYAAVDGQIEIFKILHDFGGDVYSLDENSYTILHLAVRSKNINCVQFILDLIPKEEIKQFVNLKDYKERTALFYAAFNGLIEIFKMLHDLGGDINNVDKKRQTILHYTVVSQNLNSVKFILDLISKEKLEEFINLKDYKGRTALDYAEGNVRIEILKIKWDMKKVIGETFFGKIFGGKRKEN